MLGTVRNIALFMQFSHIKTKWMRMDWATSEPENSNRESFDINSGPVWMCVAIIWSSLFTATPPGTVRVITAYNYVHKDCSKHDNSHYVTPLTHYISHKKIRWIRDFIWQYKQVQPHFRKPQDYRILKRIYEAQKNWAL